MASQSSRADPWRDMLAGMTQSADLPSTRDSLLDFVLHHLRVQIGVCSIQRVSHNDYLLPRRTVPDWNFIYITAGRAVWVIDGIEHELNAGDLAVVPPEISHSASSKSQRMHLVSVHVEAKLPGGQDVFALLPPPRKLSVTAGSQLDQYLRGAEMELQRLPDQRMVCRLYLAGWARLAVLELLRCHCRSPAQSLQTVNPLLVRILQLLNDRLTETLTLTDLSKRVGYSGQHLNRLFRKELGVTPLQHHRRLKLEKAAELLAHGSLSVQGVGEAVGIDDPFYFSRSFQQHFRKSPTEYRRLAQEASGNAT